MKIQILGSHSNESKTSRCISFLVDNVLAIDAGALTSSLTLENQKKIKSILITHTHFDHIKDIPLLALNFYRMEKVINIFALPSVNSTIKNHLLNGAVYPQLHEIPGEKPTVRFHSIATFKARMIDNYSVTAIPVNHHGKTVGYQISDSKGKTFFYTSDTGPGLKHCWQHISFSCELLIIETSLPNSYEEYARETGHLTPKLLLKELLTLKRVHGRLPQIVIVHNDPLLEHEIKEELEEVAERIKTSITIAKEGMRLRL